MSTIHRHGKSRKGNFSTFVQHLAWPVKHKNNIGLQASETNESADVSGLVTKKATKAVDTKGPFLFIAFRCEALTRFAALRGSDLTD